MIASPTNSREAGTGFETAATGIRKVKIVHWVAIAAIVLVFLVTVGFSAPASEVTASKASPCRAAARV